MGNVPSMNFMDIPAEHERLLEALRLLRDEMRIFQERLAGLEKDVGNIGVIVENTKRVSVDNSNDILNISLLEEGRSMYRPRKSHTSSSYK